MNIVLIGPRGVGKSSLGRKLALLTKRPILSTDLLISYESHGLSIPEIIRQHHGDWRPFRDLEYAVVKKIALLDGLIIDAGGGIVVDLDEQGNECFSHRKITELKRNGFLIHLAGDPVRLAQKIAQDDNRPPLSATHSESAIMRRREPFYQQAADLTINTEDGHRSMIPKTILAQLSARS
ncbi:MAG: shikimate kinase [Magnetococcales bacterium]|nr:shikimate kinase [Magnetococcales bacterium]